MILKSLGFNIISYGLTERHHKDMIDPFIQFDIYALGQISNYRKAIVDKFGLMATEAMYCYLLNQRAVDSQKTGKVPLFHKESIPESYPHYMEKKMIPSYKSVKLCGKLYDIIHKPKHLGNHIDPILSLQISYSVKKEYKQYISLVYQSLYPSSLYFPKSQTPSLALLNEITDRKSRLENSNALLKTLEFFFNFKKDYKQITKDTHYYRREDDYQSRISGSEVIQTSSRSREYNKLYEEYLKKFETSFPESERLEVSRLWYFLGYEFFSNESIALEFTWVVQKYLLLLRQTYDVYSGKDPLCMQQEHVHHIKYQK